MEKIKNIARWGVLAAIVLIAVGGVAWKYVPSSRGNLKITGPESAAIGQLCVFKIKGADSADWTITPEGTEFYKDSNDNAVVVSSAVEGDFTVLAAVNSNGKPVIVQADFTIGPATDKKRKKEKNNVEPATNLESWIETNVPNAPSEEVTDVAAIFEQVGDSIQRGVIDTVDGALAKVRQGTVPGPSGDIWEVFYDGLTEKIKSENPASAAEFGALAGRIAKTLRTCQRLHPEKSPTPRITPIPAEKASEPPAVQSPKTTTEKPPNVSTTSRNVRVKPYCTTCSGGFCNVQ